FDAEGTVAYVGVFSGGDTPYDLQKFTTSQVFTSNEDEVNEIPEGFKLGQNYPNPFNPTTNINYSIDQAGLVTLKVYDITGREVATLVNNRENAGDHTVTFDATNLASGVYIYTLQANGIRLTNRMTLIK
ncbi:MAG: T9SS type A sorting domain-containing protein, partial [Balneola sp.]|nr:T9SS type A sorting domain-containing protein [Balneola sp.]